MVNPSEFYIEPTIWNFWWTFYAE